MKYIYDDKDKYVEILNPDSVLDCYIIEKKNTMSDTCNAIKKSSRMIDHRNNPKKQWWTHVIVFTGDKRKVNESCVMALEHLLIDAYKQCDLYDLDNSKDSKKDTDNDYDSKFFYILNLLSIKGFPLEKNEVKKEMTEKEVKKENEFVNYIHILLFLLELKLV